MRHTSSRRSRLMAVVGAGAVLAPMAIGLPSWAAPSSAVAEDGTYIVMLTGDPVATYTGGVQGLAATAAADGAKLDADSSAARAYADHLRSEQAAVLASVGKRASDKQYEYTTVLNGFAAELTGAQVQKLRHNPDVAMVWEQEILEADTVSTPDYLGLRGEGGVWDTQFGGPSEAGAGIVVGVIDSGIWPENPSFADLPGTPAPPAGWAGTCEAGEDTAENNVTCNSKLIGARYYAQGNDTANDFLSPRDTNGHGSHTAGTAAGNNGVDLVAHGTDMGTASGMAPAAHVATYKALWATADGRASGSNTGLVAAIDDAVADGVDVINYSVSGSSQYVVDPVELAFLDAADAGVFVSTSAGNSGDTIGTSSVAHNAPWTMTVAASTHDRNVSKYVEVGGEGTGGVDRIAGPDRYATAAAIAREFDAPSTVYIATGDQFADALAGSASAARGLAPTASTLRKGLAAADGAPAPVLLSKVRSLPSATRAALEDLGPTDIVILGGEQAVSSAVEQQLAAYGRVTRVAGADRYDTAARLAVAAGTPDHVYVATGEGDAFADALSGSALAGSEEVPVLLVKRDHVPSTVRDALAAMGDPEVRVLGGTGAVSQKVADQLGATERLAGENRYGTSVAVSEQFGYGADNPAPGVYLATGTDYPDALAGAALAGSRDLPVVLSKPTAIPQVAVAGLEALAPQSGTLFGGTTALDENVENTLAAIVGTGSGGGERYEGIGVGDAVGPAPLVDSASIPAAGATAAQAELCLPGSLDAAAAADHIVLCTRGENARVEKSEVVAEAGGIGMILANTNDSESLNADFHAVPTIHVNGTTGDAIRAYIASDPAPTAFISASGEGSAEQVYPEMAGFSSYGPAIAGGGDLLKPDITAPGVDVLAAVSPVTAGGSMFDSMSGTSMSAPHVAGLAALMMDRYPDWSPMAVKSAMMTTADPTDSTGGPIRYAGEPSSPLHYGSGEVRPADSYETPLVYDSDWQDWYAYSCAIDQLQLVGGADWCAAYAADADASDLNYPSISVGALAGQQTVTRTVTATGAGGTFTAQVDAPAGVDVQVSPSTIEVPAGGTATFEVTMTTNGAALDDWTFGAITWTGPGADVRSPIAVRPVAVGAPDEVRGSVTDGSVSWSVTPGSHGSMTSVVSGLVPSDAREVTVVSDGPSGGPGTGDLEIPVTVAAGTTALRVETSADSWAPADADMDLFLVDASGAVVAQSAAGGSDEQFTLMAPEAGEYSLHLDYWNGAAGASAQGTVHLYTVTGDEGNFTVSPNPASTTTGQPVDLTGTWTGLDASRRYLGVVGYDFGSGVVGSTLVTLTP